MSTAVTKDDATALPAGIWSIDPVHSTVRFEVRDMSRLVATIHGRFTDYEGVLEAANGLVDARAIATVRVASLTTDHEQRDQHILSEFFLDAAGHSEARFESDQIDPTGDGALLVAGRLELKGEWRPVELQARVLGAGRDQHGAERLALAAEGQVALGPMQVKVLADVSALRETA